MRWPLISETCSNSFQTLVRFGMEARAVPIAITPDQLALQASIRDWAKQASPLAAVRRLEPSGPAAGPAT